ncbi:chorismate mutase [Brochothrix campestris]|uniref:chorismate mutase n=1 Tax=Brochothrix campestris FSL F6-1037 TaxID=1265861 RepID=W7D0T5_9LIST|nr:chorismate mutase [Brochothrix campestris]EUJ41606.1 chorismate mutase [Brochothrix campestris FSL F6-1037]
MMRGIRGATTIAQNTTAAIETATVALLTEIIERNQLQAEQISSVFFSATADVTACFPAKFVRSFKGFEYVPVIDMLEMSVPNALPLCIRVMVHCDSDLEQAAIHHVYQNEAVQLRPDLTLKEV